MGALVILYKFGHRDRRKRKGDYSRIPNVVEPEKLAETVVDLEPSVEIGQRVGKDFPQKRLPSRMRLPPPLPIISDGSGGNVKLLPPPQLPRNCDSRIDVSSPLSRSNCQLSCLNLGDISGVYCDYAADGNQGSFTAWPQSDDFAVQEKQQARIHRADGSGRLL